NTGAGSGTNRIDSSGNLVNIGNITGTGALTLQATSGTLALTATGANIIQFNTNGAEQMRLDANGNLGIGTAGPTSLLHTSQTITLAGASSIGNRFDTTFSGAPTASLLNRGFYNDTTINYPKGKFNQSAYNYYGLQSLSNPYTIDTVMTS